MDRLDRISIWAIVILIISSFALINSHMGEAKPDRHLQQRAVTAEHSAVNGEIDNKVKVAKNLMESDNLNQAEMMIKELMQKAPYDGEPHMLMGDIFMRRQEPVKAVIEYKEASDLNPDYLDKKTPFFQGKKIKIALSEALAEIEKAMKHKPDNESIKSDRKTIYYLQRKIAGSCS